MPSTTVHLPDRLLARIEQVVKEKEISRNRFIIQACEQALDNNAGQWPENFFMTDLKEEDFSLLKEGVEEMEEAIKKSRRNRNKVKI